MSEKNKTIVRRFYNDVFNAGKMNIAAIEQHLADDFVGHDLPPGLNGREGYKKFVGMFAASFSDTSQIETHEVISNGDKIVVRWSSAGTHTGEFMGLPATGQQITVKGIDIFRLANGKIVDLWQEIDLLGILQQISARLQVEQAMNEVDFNPSRESVPSQEGSHQSNTIFGVDKGAKNENLG